MRSASSTACLLVWVEDSGCPLFDTERFSLFFQSQPFLQDRSMARSARYPPAGSLCRSTHTLIFVLRAGDWRIGCLKKNCFCPRQHLCLLKQILFLLCLDKFVVGKKRKRKTKEDFFKKILFSKFFKTFL